MKEKITMDEIMNLAKQYGFVYQGSEIYGGLANSWDYGPLGVELKNNLKNLWWKEFVQKNPYNVGLDSAIILNTKVWEASGHLGGFSDPLVDCKECKTRHRADHLIENFTNQEVNAEKMTAAEINEFLPQNKVSCPNCGAVNYTEVRNFNLMFKTHIGVVEDESSVAYLRPETAQGIFINFKNIVRTSRLKVPFGVGQMGKSFRNEITPGNFIFRTREFEQMELEFFCKPGTEMEWFAYWENKISDFLTKINLQSELWSIREHDKDELSHYSNRTIDFEFDFPFGKSELWGLASRTDYDLKAHSKNSNTDLIYHDLITNEKYYPYVIEPAVGVDRLLLAVLVSAYQKEEVDGEVREVLKLSAKLAPFKVAILPLVKKLKEPALAIYEELAEEFNVDYDEAGSIGKRYRRQDVIGTPYCITIDYDTLDDNSVTLRNRDTMDQTRIEITKLKDMLTSKIGE